MLTGPMTKRRSNAKTAYGLMSDIKQYILEEPKRIWMKATARRVIAGDDYDDELDYPLTDLFYNTDVDAPYGTKRYARIVAKRIEGFQKKHAASLKAVQLPAKD